MISAAVHEIKDYLLHKDFSLAVRRTLDLVLDTGNAELMQRAVNWSNRYNLSADESAQPIPDENFSKEADALLNDADRVSAKAATAARVLLKATDISKQYHASAFSLKPMSLSINSGGVLGVVGENGNGKTTLLRVLGGQLAHDTGKIDYGLDDVPDMYALKNRIAFIPQRIPKWYGLLKDNLRFSAAISGLYGAANELMVDFMLERLNLTRFAHLDWNRISSGYRTRFELARILLQRPKLLILDEPLANLDIKAQQTILTDLIFMAKGRYNPMGIVLSSQQLYEVEKVADTVLFLKAGKCLYSSSDAPATKAVTTVEFETIAPREAISALFQDPISVHFNGGVFSLSSETMSQQEIMKTLINGGIELNYFRDITHSTKRFFN